MTTREKGVATAPCPSCGKDQPLVEQKDGGMAAETCSKCYPAPSKRDVAADVKAVTASNREAGTDTTKES